MIIKKHTYFAFLTFFLFTLTTVQAQSFKWKIGTEYFFDNMEYSKSTYASSQTLNGIWFNPMVGIAVDSTNSLYGGINVLKIPGTSKTIDKTEITLYYQFDSPKTFFRAGVFPRKDVLDNYSDFFFTDSVKNHRPLMRGIFWQIGRNGNFVNAWMDWTGIPSKNTRESFFAGVSGRVAYSRFFVDIESYMFHYANSLGNSSYGVSENLQLQGSAGFTFESGKNFKGLASAGFLAGYERDRDRDDEAYLPVGFTANLQMEYKRFGVNNLLYLGKPRMEHYNRYGSELYWGNPFLRGKQYVKSNWYVRLIENRYAAARLDLNFHYSEKEILLQQLFTVSVSFDNFMKRKKP